MNSCYQICGRFFCKPFKWFNITYRKRENIRWRTDKAAPPRESPSVLVRMMPVSGSASLKALAVLMASCPCHNGLALGWPAP